MATISNLNTGTVVGRFVYTSRGSQGWGVADEVGHVPPEVLRQALSSVERLAQPTELVEPPLAQRARRMLWAGEPDSPWKFLLHTVAAGDDSSRRPHNNVTDCLVVRRNDAGEPGCEPARLWGSNGWLTPYGSDAVSRIDLHSDDQMTLDDGGEPLVTLALAAATNHEPSFLYSVASLIVAIADGAGSPSRTATVAMVEDVDFAPIFLGAAGSVLPYDVAWDLPVEVRSVPLAGEPPLGSGIIAMTRESAVDVTGVDVLDLGGEAPPPKAAPRGVCRDCRKTHETWGSLVSQCVIGLAEASALPDADPAHIQQLAASLVQVMRHASARRVSAGDVPARCFTEVALSDSGHDDLATLFDSATAWEALAVNHHHPKVIPAPPTPKPLPGTALVQDSAMRGLMTAFHLANSRPGPFGYWQADWLVGVNRRWGGRWVVDAHRRLGRIGMDHHERMEAYGELRIDHPELTRTNSQAGSGYPLIDHCADIFLTDLMTSLLEEKQRKLPLVEGLDAAVVANIASSIAQPTWQHGLLDPRASRFVDSWLDQKPRRGYASEFLGELVRGHPLAYGLLIRAVDLSGDDLVSLLFLRDALVAAVRRDYRNSHFRGLPEAVLERLNRRLAQQTFQPPPGGARA